MFGFAPGLCPGAFLLTPCRLAAIVSRPRAGGRTASLTLGSPPTTARPRAPPEKARHRPHAAKTNLVTDPNVSYKPKSRVAANHPHPRLPPANISAQFQHTRYVKQTMTDRAALLSMLRPRYKPYSLRQGAGGQMPHPKNLVAAPKLTKKAGGLPPPQNSPPLRKTKNHFSFFLSQSLLIRFQYHSQRCDHSRTRAFLSAPIVT